MLILWNAEGVRSWWTIQAELRTHDSVHSALGCATGVSGGSAYTVPTLLLPGGRGRDPLPQPGASTIRGRDQAGGRECFVLDCAPRDRESRAIWIGCDDFLIHRIEEQLVLDGEMLASLRERMEKGLESEPSEEHRSVRRDALEHLSRSPPSPQRIETTTTYEASIDASIDPERFETPRSWANPEEPPAKAMLDRHSIVPLVAADVALPASKLLAQVRRAYGSCRSYKDTGLVTTVFIHDMPSRRRHTDKKPFATAFVRPERFRFEYAETESEFEDELEHILILWNGEGLRSWWTIQPGILTHESFRDAVGQAAGVSGGSSCLAPCLLLPGGGDRDPLPTDESTAILGTELVGGHDCFVLRGRLVRGDERTLWIGRSDSLIRRVEESRVFDESWRLAMLAEAQERMTQPMSDEDRKVTDQTIQHFSKPLEPFRTEETITYEPEVDVLVPDDRFATPDSWR
jgi:hypothetical protein